MVIDDLRYSQTGSEAIIDADVLNMSDGSFVAFGVTTRWMEVTRRRISQRVCHSYVGNGKNFACKASAASPNEASTPDERHSVG